MEQLANAEQIARTNRIQMTTLKSERDEFEKQYRALTDLHSQCRIRETLHLAKVQESLNVAEAAIKERDAAIEHEKEIRGIFRNQNWKFSRKFNQFIFRGMRSFGNDHWPCDGRSG